MTMGTGGAYVQPLNIKLNTKSSTVASTVGFDNVLKQVIWTGYFPKDHIYEIYDNTIYQDNQISIKLGNNTRRSISKNTCLINYRYYFITDRITKQ